MEGIDRCGERLSKLVEEKVMQLNHRGRVSKISFFAYSMGGLVARYTIGQLYARGFFDEIAPITFVTLACPRKSIYVSASHAHLFMPLTPRRQNRPRSHMAIHNLQIPIR